MSGFWKCACAAVLGLALAAGPAPAQHRPHPGGHPAVHHGGVHPAAVHHGGYHGGPYYGGHHHHSSGWAIGIGLGFGGPFYGGYYGGPYYGGYYGGFAYPSYGYAVAPVAVPVYPAPVIPPAVSGSVESIPTPPQPADAGKAAPATVSVVVPAGAELWFNGKQQPAGSGQFVSDPIPPGQTVNLDVKARWGGSDRSMRIPLRTGDQMTVDLTRP